MTKNALQFACRFSLPPNSLGYCGQDSAPTKFKRCIADGQCADIEAELAKFIVLNPYLETLAHITHRSKFAYQVLEAYWLGNAELTKAQVADYDTLLHYFTLQGVPTWFVTELKAKLPKVFIPHHLFQVLHIGVGKASGSVPFTLETINNCMIRWGEVVAIKPTELVANLYSLTQTGGAYHLTQTRCSATYSSSFLPHLKLGTVVAVHWGQAVKLLSAKETANLAFWTRQVLTHVN
jgi:hypothetical protein